ncbi:hypothetical protein [Pelotomaculum sp. FP]|uniref:hypothetical protein n=1 Tax=Pelotomaculum sp. FP TaxID=261474 RepID=UPI001291CF74|nr:hypothetical protein [Pelotomaculum sp. FP]
MTADMVSPYQLEHISGYLDNLENVGFDDKQHMVVGIDYPHWHNLQLGRNPMKNLTAGRRQTVKMTVCALVKHTFLTPTEHT